MERGMPAVNLAEQWDYLQVCGLVGSGGAGMEWDGMGDGSGGGGSDGRMGRAVGASSVDGPAR